MGTNVSEWCVDPWDDKKYAQMDEKGMSYTPWIREAADLSQLSHKADERAYRGGSFNDESTNCEAATRRFQLKGTSSPYIGFRPVLVIAPELFPLGAAPHSRGKAAPAVNSSEPKKKSITKGRGAG